MGVGDGCDLVSESELVDVSAARSRAPVKENGRDGAYEKVPGCCSCTAGRPLTKGRVAGRRGPRSSDLSAIRWSPAWGLTGQSPDSDRPPVGSPQRDEPDRRDVTPLVRIATTRHHRE